jgi:hypothetical protein
MVKSGFLNLECSKLSTLFADFGREGGRAKQRPGESTARAMLAQMHGAYLLTPTTPPIGGWSTLSFASKKEGSYVPLSTQGSKSEIELPNSEINGRCLYKL